ncbi:MAG TPA: class I SAM-dependent RNA methyltransferase [Proteobacteria bacterium]|nr:class I SAM-dependent RNA methyltransferase [Pseudomonadota bacterium]
MSIFPQSDTLIIPCAKGIPPFLSAELKHLGFPVVAESVASVSSRGTLADAMRLNLHCRTGQRVLFQLESWDCPTQDKLFLRLSHIPWETYIPADGYLSVTSVVDHPSVRDRRFINQKTKDVIVDRIRRLMGRRPDSGPRRHGVVVHVFWKQNQCGIYLDTSGESLARRGYRQEGGQAPLQETLAAAVVQEVNWDGTGSFLNPMCGSGTLAIEAALKNLDIPPGLRRRNYAFMHLCEFPRDVWQSLLQEARKQVKQRLSGRVIATDSNPAVVEMARNNARRAGVESLIEFGVGDFAQISVPAGGGVVVLNPEYGERLGELEALTATYRRIGDFFKQRCAGFRGFILTGNRELAKKVGLKASRKIPLYNGPIECRLLEYEIYAGSQRRTD